MRNRADNYAGPGIESSVLAEDKARPPLAQESPVLIRVDGKDLSVLFCTPLSLDELAVGHLVSRGLLPDRETLRSIFVCDDRGRVDIYRNGGPPLTTEGLALIGSACGAAGTVTAELFGLVPEKPAKATVRGLEDRISLETLSGHARAMFAGAVMYRETGGLHCAALVSLREPGTMILREDVGRHNAVDKVLGRGFLDGIDFGSTAILSSGRIAADMVAKAAHVGARILASRSVATTSAFELARAWGITLVGRVGSRDPQVYCDPEELLEK